MSREEELAEIAASLDALATDPCIVHTRGLIESVLLNVRFELNKHQRERMIERAFRPRFTKATPQKLIVISEIRRALSLKRCEVARGAINTGASLGILNAVEFVTLLMALVRWERLRTSKLTTR